MVKFSIIPIMFKSKKCTFIKSLISPVLTMFKSKKRIFINSLIALVLVFCLSVLSISFYKPAPNFQDDSSLVVILGAGYLKNGKPVLALEKRLDKGVEVWDQLYKVNLKEVYILLSGRKEEVHVMYEYLIRQGISKEYLMKDEFSLNTRDTIKYSYQEAQQLSTAPIFISQAYHIPRIIFYSIMNGHKNVNYVATDRVQIPFHKLLYVSGREVLAIIFFPISILILKK